MTYLLGISGSLRKAATNTKLIRAAAAAYGGDFVQADLRVPLYDGDLETEEGVPAAVQLLADQIDGAEAVIISSPEYNKRISGVLKNALDWVSRTNSNPWKNKPLAIMSATAGRAGGERAQFDLRLCMVPFRARIIQGPELLLADSSNQFDDDGGLVSPIYAAKVQDLMTALKDEVARG
ncbi:NAD(P)H-dependent oxidoreductase [Octadecabacter sp.]|nr:NAD(P)H-dependent oxidoreductase [Octadecabacter sp.]